MEKYGIQFHIFPYICYMVVRQAYAEVLRLASGFKSIAITGARQSGKTTLVKELFPDKPYISLENPDSRRFAIEDPRGFLNQWKNGAVLDEVQRTPELFSYLQELLDNSKSKGQFILTGSNNFLLQASISQSLAGRVAYFQLPAFSISELQKSSLLPADDDDLMLKGFYPPVYDQDIPAVDWSRNYISTYVEKDVRQIKNIIDLNVFERFLSLLAGRCSQELNMSALAIETGVDVKTVQSWISLLESSYIIFLLKSHHRNFNKMLVKRPKLYFCDTSIVCSLLRITEKNHIESHPLRGAIFENMVVAELRKSYLNNGSSLPLFYWRDKTGHEVDVIIEKSSELLPVEIKSGRTVSGEYFRNLHYWIKQSKMAHGFVLYGGKENQQRSNGIQLMNWREYVLGDLF